MREGRGETELPPPPGLYLDFTWTCNLNCTWIPLELYLQLRLDYTPGGYPSKGELNLTQGGDDTHPPYKDWSCSREYATGVPAPNKQLQSSTGVPTDWSSPRLQLQLTWSSYHLEFRPRAGDCVWQEFWEYQSNIPVTVRSRGARYVAPKRSNAERMSTHGR